MIMDWARILAYITGSVNQELLLRNEYLVAENRILKAQIKTPLRLTDGERITLAEIAHRLGRKALEAVANQVSRYLVKDFGTSKSPKSTRKRDAYYSPAALRPCRFATPSQARRWLRSTPSNGWTAC